MKTDKRVACGIVLTLTALLSGCSGLQAPKVEETRLYVLDARPETRVPAQRRDRVLGISMPTAWPGYDTPQMAYQKQALKLDYFATQRWADTPPRLLKPLLIQALQPAFSAVVTTPGMVPADFRLDTELIQLQQNFSHSPSRIQLTLRAQLINVADKRVVAVKLFDEAEDAASDDAYAGVLAANRALQRILEQLSQFCLDASAIR